MAGFFEVRLEIKANEMPLQMVRIMMVVLLGTNCGQMEDREGVEIDRSEAMDVRRRHQGRAP